MKLLEIIGILGMIVSADYLLNPLLQYPQKWIVLIVLLLSIYVASNSGDKKENAK